jgi:PAS domain S-box-containing protein
MAATNPWVPPLDSMEDLQAGGFRRMLDVAPVAIYATDAEGRVTYFNAAAVTFSGRVPELGTDKWSIAWKLFRADGTPLPHEECPMAVALSGGAVPPNSEYIAERPDGTLVWFLPFPAALRGADGEITGGVNVLVDITARKEAQDASTRLLGAIVDSSDDAIISKDLNGVITSWNQSAQRLFGYTAEEAVGRPILILIPQERQQEEVEILSRLRRGERVDHFETIRRRKDGVLLDVSLTISPVKDLGGRIVGASKIARDITDRKRADEAVRASRARFQQLADSMPQIVWTAGADGQLDYFNERWYEFSGHPRDRFGDAAWDSILHPEDMARCRAAWYDAVAAGASFESEVRFWDRHESRWRWFIARALPIRDELGRIAKWFGTSTDIDDQKRVEDELRHANQDLQQFAFSASHDLQEPLRTVKIFSDLLAQRHSQQLDAQALEFLGHLHRGATRMEMLVRDLLAFTQITKVQRPDEPADANAALAVTLSNLAGVISESGARISSDALPSLHVHQAHLQQLFQNLIGNAIKYRSPDRPPEIHVTAEGTPTQWRFAVSDNGIGIDPKYKETIFGLFKRLHAGDQYSGTGIGLAICERIVERYHGRIWVESEPGRGSTFRFTFPV